MQLTATAYSPTYPFFFSRQIREDTETRIDLPTESSSSDVIVITGRKENVQKARARILEIEKEMVIYLYLQLLLCYNYSSVCESRVHVQIFTDTVYTRHSI